MIIDIRDDRHMRALTGLSLEQFEQLLAAFRAEYEAQQWAAYEQGKEAGMRQRRPGGGAKGKLLTMADKLLFVVIGLDWQPPTVYRRYRTRFGVESSYRILRRVRVKTTSRNPALRFFLLGFALLLVNVWAFLRWFVARIPGRGPHRVHPTHFQFQMFVCLLRRAIEQRYGACHGRANTHSLKS